MSMNRSDNGSWRVILIAVVLGLGAAAWAAAQVTSPCTPLGAQTCAPTFSDAGDFSSGFLCYATRVVQAGIMTGCGGDMFCPLGVVTRADMAVFLEDAKHHNDTPPRAAFPAATGIFPDVPKSFPLACWIEQFYHDGITAGCGGGNYCPDSPVTRGQMAVFILSTKGINPPTCTTQIFNDVPCTSGFAKWINEIYNECITAGCGGGNYCPDNPISRQEMAVFLWAAFLRAPCGGPPACTACALCS